MVNGPGLAGGDALHAFGAAAAIEAAVGFGHGRGFGVALINFVKSLDPLGLGQLGHYGPGLEGGVFRHRRPVACFQGNGTQGEFPVGLQILAIHITVDGERGFPAGGHRGDGDIGTGDHVAAGKDAFPAGGQGHRVRLNEAPGGKVDAVSFGDKGEVGLLADGHDHQIGIMGFGFIFQIGGSETALVVKDPVHGPEFQAADLTIPGHNLLDAPAMDDL